MRLAIVDLLAWSDRSPGELESLVDVPSNLLAHHLDVLVSAGLVERHPSSGDGRRRYVHLRRRRVPSLAFAGPMTAQPARFVCTANSARSQLAAALWRSITGRAADSAGTHPADAVHPGALAAARRAGLDLGDARPRRFDPSQRRTGLTVTVCDRAHEELDVGTDWLHWSIGDPLAQGTDAAFDATIAELQERIGTAALGDE